MTAPLGEPLVNPRPPRAFHAPGPAALVGALVAALVAAACAGPAPSPAAPTQPPPSQSPVQASPNPNLVAFTLHIQDAKKAEGQLVRDLATAQSSPNQLRVVARNLAAWATNEQAWLDANEADSCYEPAYQSWRDGVSDVAKAAAGFLVLADVARPSPDAGQVAGTRLASGTTALNTATGLADQARAACR
jgi:hypothetical protein